MTSGKHVSYEVSEFLKLTKEQFTGNLRDESKQTQTWDHEFDHLQKVLSELDIEGHIIFEYGIPSLNFVIDVVLLTKGKIFVIEYKDGDSSKYYAPIDLKQCRNYALRLKYFHSTSSDRWIIPILVEMSAPDVDFDKDKNDEISVWNTIKCNQNNLAEAISTVNTSLECDEDDNKWEESWENGIYKATPTIIKAACEMWERQNVRGLDSGESDPDTRLAAEDYVLEIVLQAKANKSKSIVFVTGVPGAGKTLVGLGLSVRCQDYGASMLSGNDPLVRVLSTALRRDLDKQYKTNKKFMNDEIIKKYEHAKAKGLSQKEREKEKDAISVDAVIRTAYAYKQEIIQNRLNWGNKTYTLREGVDKGSQHVIIFDEAQRAWTREKMLTPGQSGKKEWQDKENWPFSEPGLLLWDMNQRDWGVFVCLVGGGQEINTGEAGIGEWMKVLATDPYKGWQIYLSNQLVKEEEYQRRNSDNKLLQDYCKEFEKQKRLNKKKELHLTESQRSIRNSKVSDFVNKLLSRKVEEAKTLYEEIFPTYKIYLTRNVQTAKEKLKEMKSSGEFPEITRMGMLMSSEAARMRPFGYEIKKVREYLSKTPNWFLDSSEYVGSSDYLEVALNEFFVQGLEIDYATVMWDADFRYDQNNNDWEYFCFDGKNKWSKRDEPHQDIKRFYMKNAYRVLLTRARLGMVIFVPEGSSTDKTRNPKFYDCTYNYLKSIGIKEI
ncbi:MAG: DUF2075 domain-containing protein [Bacteroidales bacterium]|nr:DUF2075 domain-containing protein [Bacteroidales bacterium]